MFTKMIPPAKVPLLPVTATYTANSAQTGSGPTYTFSGVGIGPADSDRIVIALFSVIADNLDEWCALNSATIGGIGTTVLKGEHQLRSSNPGVSVYMAGAYIPTGTTATIVAYWSHRGRACNVHTYQLFNSAGVTGYSSASAAGNGDTGGPFAVNLNVPADGAVITGACGKDSEYRDIVWTGITEDHQRYWDTKFAASCCSEEYSVAQTPEAITFDHIGNDICGISYSWRNF